MGFKMGGMFIMLLSLLSASAIAMKLNCDRTSVYRVLRQGKGLVMDRHDLTFLIEGIISFILIVVLSIFVNLQSANAKEKETKWKEKECTDLYNAIVLFTKLSGKEWKQKNEEKGSFYASTAADYTIIYSTFCTK